jgi:hypothetical protein
MLCAWGDVKLGISWSKCSTFTPWFSTVNMAWTDSLPPEKRPAANVFSAFKVAMLYFHYI